MHTVSSQNFRSLSFSGVKVIRKINNQDHVGKKLSKSNSLEVYVAISRKNMSLTFLFFFNFFIFFLIALYGARVRGSVFRMKFRVLSREFESIETSPGFAQLLGENWN